MIYSNDQEWDEWESSFEQQFWMTIDERKEEAKRTLCNVDSVEERKEKAQKTLPDVNSQDVDEKMAADALFDLFSSNMFDSEGDNMNLEPMNINNDLLIEATMQAAKDIVDNGNPSTIVNSANHHSSTPEVNVIQQNSEENPLSDEGLKSFPALPNQNVIEDDIRDRKEEEQSARLNEKSGNSILNYTVRQQNGINQTERKTSKSATKVQNNKGKISSQKGQKKTNGKKQQKTLSNAKKRKFNNDQNSKETTKKVC